MPENLVYQKSQCVDILLQFKGQKYLTFHVITLQSSQLARAIKKENYQVPKSSTLAHSTETSVFLEGLNEGERKKHENSFQVQPFNR